MESHLLNLSPEQRRAVLSQKIVDSAVVVDAKKGYILCKEINHTVNFALLKEAAFLTNTLFLQKIPYSQRPQKIIGIPNRGKEFALALGLTTNSNLLQGPVTERFQEENKNFNHHIRIFYEEEKDMLTITGIPSFTKPGVIFTHTIRGLKPGVDKNVLIADDFAATGTVSRIYCRMLKSVGIEPYFVFLAAKDFPDFTPPQIGLRKLSEEAPAFALVRFTGIKNGKVVVEV